MIYSSVLGLIVRMGDALLGQFARAFVLLFSFLAPAMSKNISWEYNTDDVGPIVPEWGGPSANEKRSSRQAEFA
ncbi:hypothetical protein PHMEG_00031626 [Phytophthora megakarya]|uniref:Uncharacterized protein n=1 Tax=Phytophthora megakarya TaxID=4795 RepID=A0A225UXT7_9STRA|nr:hypothetical protein PHMEG_00031626 [Phytophthora megakarya]